MQLASNWPERLADVNDVFVMRIVGKMQEDGSLAAARWELIDALSKSQWKLQFGEPSKLWKDLVLHLLENGEPTRASEVALRVTAPSILIGMRADRRFEKVIASNPAHFDIAKATESNIAALRASVAEHPRSLEALMELTYALLTALRYDEVLQLTTVAIERAQAAPKDTGPFDDIDSYLNWVMDNRVLALRGLGRWDEAIRQRIVAAATLENGHVNVSHAINLAQTYADTARAADALATLAKVGDDLSPYGRMQVEIVKLSVAAQMHDNAEITRVMDYVALHRKDSEETYQIALVVANRLDEAFGAFSRARQIDPQSAQAYCGLGLVFQQQGRWWEAADAFKRTEQLAPKRVEGGGQRASVPVTIRALLGARIDSLSDTAREVLRIASVVGMSFREAFVEEVVGDAVDPAIYERLAEASLIVPVDGAGQWRFGHPLIHDAAYAGLLAARRRRVHARVADRLEVSGTRGAIGVVARHHAAAGDRDRAVPLLTEAAEEALAVGAAEEAAEFWTAAADLLGTDPSAEDPRRRAREALELVPAPA